MAVAGAMKRATALLLAAALAACSSTGERERTLRAVTGSVLALFGATSEPTGDGPDVTRAELDALAGPVISVRRGGGPRVFVRAASAHRGEYVVYTDTARRGLTLHGSSISGTHNFGIDIVGVAWQRDDPLVVAAPVDEWPEVVDRAYKFHRRDLPTETITVRCRLAQIGPTALEIVERVYDTVEVIETCTDGRLSFENRHWAERDTGFVWKSTQWIGPRLSPVTIEIINPYLPG